jgi:hypothetical protein
VFSDPLTAGLKPTSNGETKAQRGMIDEVPEIRCTGWRHISELGGGIDCSQQIMYVSEDLS